MKKLLWAIVFLGFTVVPVLRPACALAACAKVSIEILQSLTLERVAFDARLVLTNNVPDTPLENIRLDIAIKNQDGKDRSTLFFVRQPVLSGITALDGTGRVEGSARGEAHWLIIPAPGAGVVLADGVAPQIGVDYWVGATLTYSVNGIQEIVSLNPAKITVKPMPQLVIDYFIPYNVVGDNPFTPQVEPSVPFPLAVRVLNDGYGPAAKLKIDSAQPRIVEDSQGLLVDFKLLGAAVNDGTIDPSLTVNFGDVGSKKVATAFWEMSSTLTGRFIEFKAEFSHASELGGELTSLIQETNTHYLTHRIKVNLPGRDTRLDFLADTDNDDQHLPDTIFESEIPNGSTDAADSRSPVSVALPLVQPLRPTALAPSVDVVLPVEKSGFIYTRMTDPSQGMLKLLDVVRNDGVHLDPNNFWVDEGVDKNFARTFTLQFIDYRGDTTVPGTYKLVFDQPVVDSTPPLTTLIFDGPALGTDPVYITPKTRLILTATDNDGGSGVAGMFRKISGLDTDFVPAYPVAIDSAGTRLVEYYSIDREGNRESTKSTTVTVVSAPPVIGSFRADPAVIAPRAPRGVVAARGVEFSLTVTGGVSNLPVSLDIVAGGSAATGSIVRSIAGSATSAVPLKLTWDGGDSSGKPVPSGAYTARLRASDGLDNPLDQTAPVHTAVSDIQVSVIDWFAESPLDPNPTADQIHPRISGQQVVWQDRRNGSWDVYFKETTAAVSTRITTGSADHQWPAVDNGIIVWQDNRSGGWEIYGYRVSSKQEFPVATGTGDKERPVVSGDWVVWQDRRNGNWDIYAKNIATSETQQLTNHERDQIHPSISGTVVVWEDYRHGLGTVYSYDLTTRQETRVTADAANKSLPVVSGAKIAWSDERNGQKDIYCYDKAKGIFRSTYGSGDHDQAAVFDDLLVFTDFENGPDDPNLSFRILSDSMGGRLSSHPARQEEPAVAGGMVVWQDNRSGSYQIYGAPLLTEALPIEVAVVPGFNLLAVGDSLVAQYPTAVSLLNAKRDELGIDRIVTLDALHNRYQEADAQRGDFPLTKGMGIILYLAKSGSLLLAGSGETATYNLIAGTNQVGLLSVPSGYGAYDLMNSLGLDNVQSVRRFNGATGAWQTVSVRTSATGNQLVGLNFGILPGDGLQIIMKHGVDGWAP